MPYIVYELKSAARESLGQSWNDEELTENYALCEQQTIRHQFARYLKSGDTVLEAGCGLGRWVRYLRQRGYGAVGIEASETAVNVVRRSFPELPVSVGDVRRTGFATEQFDAVVSLGVMEHFIDGPDEVLRETWRILKPGGLLFASIPPANLVRRILSHPKLRIYTLLTRLLGRHYEFSEYRYTEKQFSRYLQAAGFTIVEIVTDELDSPLNMGLYVDFPLLRHRQRKWELNRTGVLIQALLARISAAIARGGVMFVCRKPGAACK